MVDLLETQFKNARTGHRAALGRDGDPSEVGKLIAFLLGDDGEFFQTRVCHQPVEVLTVRQQASLLDRFTQLMGA